MRRCLLICLLSASVCAASAQQLAKLTVDISRPMHGLSMPAEVDLDAITLLPDSTLMLLQGEKNIPFQIDNNGHRTLHWLIDPQSGKKATYSLIQKTPPAGPQPAPDSMRATAADGELTITDGGHDLLRYVYKTVYPPAGIDTAYRKSGFIHPLWTPHGQVLTRIQAPDHYHHYGVWDPWTHILYKGDTVDCWNLVAKKGTVRFARFASLLSGPVFAQYEALQEHVVFHKTGGEEVFMNELQTVKVYRTSADTYLFDLTIQLNCATPNPVLLLAYRYGGVGWRATPEWNKDNSEVLTSEGKTRKEADGSKARWCIVQGTLGSDYGGAVMLSYPGNYNYPEPLRVWPDNSNGRGDMYANFSPTKDIDWPLQPGRNYVLRYRWVVFNGHFDKDKAESAWQYFAAPPHVTIKK